MVKIYEVILSRLANNDLESIHSYISDKLLSNYSADRIYNMILEAICSLDQFPARIPLMKTEPEREKGYRLMTIEKYAVIFVINKDNSFVEILRILYGASDIVSRLSNHDSSLA